MGGLTIKELIAPGSTRLRGQAPEPPASGLKDAIMEKLRPILRMRNSSEAITIGAGPENKIRSILLLGEADFGFIRALVTSHPELQGVRIVATNYDSRGTAEREGIMQKYPNTAESNERYITQHGVEVRYEVDAKNLEATFPNEKFDLVIFNSPHTGDYTGKSNQELIEGFFRSSRSITNRESYVLLITIDDSCHDGRFQIPPASRRSRFELFSRKTFDSELEYTRIYQHKKTKEDRTAETVCDFNRVGQVFKKVEADDRSFDSQDESLESDGLLSDEGREHERNRASRKVGRDLSTSNQATRKLRKLRSIVSKLSEIAEFSAKYKIHKIKDISKAQLRTLIPAINGALEYLPKPLQKGVLKILWEAKPEFSNRECLMKRALICKELGEINKFKKIAEEYFDLYNSNVEALEKTEKVQLLNDASRMLGEGVVKEWLEANVNTFKDKTYEAWVRENHFATQEDAFGSLEREGPTLFSADSLRDFISENIQKAIEEVPNPPRAPREPEASAAPSSKAPISPEQLREKVEREIPRPQSPARERSPERPATPALLFAPVQVRTPGQETLPTHIAS